ncbi:Ger(x)C family spore germination protein [Cohnella luojiensis]|uniref:Ger(X)C family spore germination protein n=1 Tax=Cohnella luojiensis TaxID=652876 RepID=A0A4Y8M208_9BACL|nr:Ger(x)C family spore germination protein [Cohnella luojiensis]TFE26628.1 Ger(x)C family spore germination protein [Cohnella luojiensis]
MKTRKLALILLFVVLALIVTGCWNRREMNDLAIAIAIGIDKSGKQFRLSAQVVDPGEVAAKKGGGTRTPVTMYQATGNTIFEALRKMTTVAPRKIYMSHVRMLSIQEDVAKEGIGKVLDFMSRDHEVRTDFFIVIAKDTSAANTLKILTHLESIPANQMFSSLQTSEQAWAPAVTVTLDKLIADIVSEGKHPVVTGLRIRGEQKIGESKRNVEEIASPAQLQYSGLAVFNNDKLIGWLNEEQSKGYNYIIDKVKSTVGVVACPNGGKASIEVVRSKTEVKGKLMNGKPRMDVNVRIEANVGEVECSMDLTKTKTISELENSTEKRAQSIIKMTIEKVQEKYKVDIFGFGEAISRYHPKYWKKVKGEWDRIFVDLPVHVNVDVKIRRLGTVGNSFLEEMKKKE